MRIYDAFIFDGELDLLEHRFAESYGLVDVFVLVEAAQTFQGQPKPLLFQQHHERFAWATPKVRHVALPRLPGKTTWERETFQRNAIQLGLYDAQPDDIILIMDADEIPSRSVLQHLRADGLDRPKRIMMTRHYGHFDTLAPRSACCVNPNDPFPYAVPHLKPEAWDKLSPTWWCMPGVAVRFKDVTGDTTAALPARTPNDLRRANQSAPRLRDGGRHLSAIAGAEELQTKLSHFSHAEHADERSLDLQHLERTSKHGVHARGWWFAESPIGELPEDLQRLSQQDLPAGKREQSLGRRVVRTWAWLRHAPQVPRRLGCLIDHHFEQAWLFLFVPLLTADVVRSGLAWWRNRTPATDFGIH